MKLDGKLCVVTGASSGIGQAIAAECAAHGAQVIGFARRFESGVLEALPAAGEVREVALDVTDEAAVDAQFAALPRVDVLVCCAGGGAFGSLTEMSLADLRMMLEGHIVGTFLCCRAALRHMRPARRGHIVAIGSSAVRNAFAGGSGYVAAKSGQMALCRVLREEVREDNIRVTELNPGATDTPIWDGNPGFDRTKMMRPADVAGVVVDVVSRPAVSVEDLLVLPPGGNL